MKKLLVDKSTGEVLPRIKTVMNVGMFPKDYESNNDPSMTMPGQSMTIQEMIERHRRGLPIEGAKGAPVYHEGEDPLPDLDKMDLIDRQAYIDSVADALVEVKARLAEGAKTKAEKEFLEKVDAAVREKLKTINKGNITDVEEVK